MGYRRCLLAAVCAALVGCATTPAEPVETRDLQSAPRVGSKEPPPLPMRVPIKGVMAGIIDFSAHGIFATATSEMALTEDDWLAAGLASINLISSATLITSQGAGPHDEAWVTEPEWRQWAAAYQRAAIEAATAIRRKDRVELLTAANQLANACQSCHNDFRVTDQRPPSQFAEMTAPTSLKEFARAWPQPAK